MLEIFTDGCSLGNPGEAGIGVVVYKNKRILKKISVYIGKTTNNFAEYTAVIIGLSQVLQLKEKKVNLYSDSELVVRQVEGKYKIKDKALYPLYTIVQHLTDLIGDCQFFHKKREENKLADSLAKKAALSKSKTAQINLFQFS